MLDGKKSMKIKSDLIKIWRKKLRYFIMENLKTGKDHIKESPAKKVFKPILVKN